MKARLLLSAAQRTLTRRLGRTSDSPELDARVLLAHLLAQPTAWVLAHPEVPLSAEQARRLEQMAAQLEAGLPLPYLLGRREFFGLEFEVTPEVLIPRPETELLVERAIRWLGEHTQPDRPLRAIDIGTGSGCIAIALAVRTSTVRLSATDISASALQVARRNAARHGQEDRIEFACCDLFPATNGEYDLVVANLPYIPTRTLRALPVFGREPTLALDGGTDGLASLRRLLTQAPDRLAVGGLLLMEIEAGQGPSMLSLAYDSFSQAEIHLHKDLAGHDRILEVQV